MHSCAYSACLVACCICCISAVSFSLASSCVQWLDIFGLDIPDHSRLLLFAADEALNSAFVVTLGDGLTQDGSVLF